MDTNATAVRFTDTSALQTLNTTPVWSAGNKVLTCAPVTPWPTNHVIAWTVNGVGQDGKRLTGIPAGMFTAAASGGPPPAGALAPQSLAGQMLTVTVDHGRSPFTTNGSYRIFVSVLGSNYVVLGRAGPLSLGICDYSAKAATGSAALADSVSGPGTALTLVFTSGTNGTLALTNSAAFQTATFAMAAWATPGPPQLFLPSLSNGSFRSYLSGQPGFGYTVETSTNLTVWSPLLRVALSDLTTNFADSASGRAGFYRAHLTSTPLRRLA